MSLIEASRIHKSVPRMPRVGIKIVCFRKRYYQLSIIFPGEPQHWANDIAAQIPTDAAEYQLWLATQRKDFEKWEAWYEEYLSIKPGNEVTDDEPGRPENFIYKPSLLASTNDTCTGWVYTTDLDRETFSVNNGAHFKLDRVPHIDWVHSLAIGNLGDTISLPGAVPKEAVTRLAVEHTSEGAELSNAPGDLAVSDVSFLFMKAKVEQILTYLRLPQPSTRWLLPKISQISPGVSAVDRS